MNLALINPFITSAKHVFDTVFQMTVDVAAPAMVFQSAPSYAVSGVIGVSGDVVGNVSLTFPVETARRIASLFTGLEPRLLEADDIADAVGELADMIVGRVRAHLHHPAVSMSCPTVLMGRGHLVQAPSRNPGIALPCTCEAGAFSIELAIAGDADAVESLRAAKGEG